jgi:hypothetical protein
MDDLVEFLRARIAEDEEPARLAHAVDPAPWYEDVEDGSYTNQRDHLDGVGLVRAADNVGLWNREQSSTLSMAAVTATHVARHNPARVLAEVEVKRAIVTRAKALWDSDAEGYGAGLDILQLLALPYADHPDYRPEWAPPA